MKRTAQSPYIFTTVSGEVLQIPWWERTSLPASLVPMSTEDALDRYISPPWDPRPDRAFSPIELSTNPTGEGTAGSLSTPYSLTGGDLPRGRKRNADEMESDAPTSSSRVIAPHDYRLTPSGSTVSSESATADTIFWEYLQGVTSVGLIRACC